MSTLPSLSPKELIKVLKKKGFELDRSKGSHQIFIYKTNRKRVVVPMHNKELPKGTLHAILKQANIDKDDL